MFMENFDTKSLKNYKLKLHIDAVYAAKCFIHSIVGRLCMCIRNHNTIHAVILLTDSLYLRIIAHFMLTLINLSEFIY